MNINKAPLYQTLIQNIPFGKYQVCNLLGSIINGKVKCMVNHASFRLDIKEGIQRQMFLGAYEPTQTKWFKECISEGDIFIDIGASFGHYTSLGSYLIGKKGKVFAFEPSPVASQVIERMIEESNISNIVLVKAAVGQASGSTNLYMPNTEHLHSPSIMESDTDFTPLQIPIVSLDTFDQLKNINQIKLIKMDVEGYEPNVLDGMEVLIKEKKIKNIFCEFNSWWLERNSTTPKELLERFLDYGYEIHKQTNLQESLPGHKGVSFSLQDIWFKLSEK